MMPHSDPDPLESFHPAVAGWFRATFDAPTPAQVRAWPAIGSGRHALIAAPTGSGKTLAAFMTAIDGLVRRGQQMPLPDQTFIVYVSPLKALSNDVRINLEGPLAGIREQLEKLGLPDVDIRTMVRTGDTPQGERLAMRKRPPHIVVTTPESLYVLLGSASGRQMLASTRSVIVDEIHALAGNKRGAHLALSLERLEALCGRRLVRIGLSATQKPIGGIARFLVGIGGLEPSPAQAIPTPSPSSRQRQKPSPSSGLQQKPSPSRGGLGGDGVGVEPASGEHHPHPNPPPEGEGAEFAPPEGEGDDFAPPVGEGVQCAIVDVGYTRRRDLAIEVPPAPLEAVMSGEVWALVYNRLAELIEGHRTTLLFVNTRRMAERVARHLSERLGKEAVAAHHGSLSREIRLDAEQRLKRGALRVLVATASLELGIDIGEVELVCQIGSPRSISGFLQRVGRSGHTVGGTPKGRLFPLSRDDLAECAALLDAVRRGELDTLRVERLALDVLAQQIVAEVACQDWSEAALFDVLRRAWPYATLTRERYTGIVRMLAEGYSTRRGPRSAYLHRDAVNGMLRARRGARLTAITSGGAIPDTADYDVVLEPQAQRVGSVHEDFAVESMAGDIFQLGNVSYRIVRIERGRLRVEDAQGLPPTIPFWLGEAPGRSDELSFALSRLREEIAARLHGGNTEPLSPAGEGRQAAERWLVDEVGIAPAAARQLIDYYAAARAALGMLPTQHELAMERFFDESGGTQLVVHSPFGVRVNRAWGLALRKRFCRSFNFELQAAATDDAIVLSLSTSHSFPLADVAGFLHSNSVRQVLVQALLDAPMFPLRWRWNATTALALPRFAGGKRVPPQIQRMRSEDLLATVFPDQVACLENIVGERQVPDHPLVAQTLHDCLHEAMDIAALEALLRRIESGQTRIVARDLTEPSPLAAEILGARPYAFLDDAPLEERRTQAVLGRRWSDPESADDLGRLDAAAIEAVRAEAWPEARDAEELHEALMGLGWLTADEAARGPGWEKWLAELAAARRATLLSPSPPGRGTMTVPNPHPDPLPGGEGEKPALWIAAERLPQFLAIHPRASLQPRIDAPAEYAQVAWTAEEALPELLRARLTGLGPVTVSGLAASIGLPAADVELALLRLEREGYVMRGRFTPGAQADQWCERHLLARIHRYTIGRLRREIEPVEPREFMRFLFEWQRVAPGSQAAGPDALAAVLGQLEGFEAAAGAWESELLPLRVADYEIAWLDELSMTGRVTWTRLRVAAGNADSAPRTGAGPVRSTPIVLLPRKSLSRWTGLTAGQIEQAPLSSRAQRVADWLREHGACFFDELADGTRLLHAELEDALAELVAAGLVNADGFAGLRALLVPSNQRAGKRRKGGRRPALFGIADAGRWSLLRRARPEPDRPRRDADDAETLEYFVRVLLRRYGVLAWQLMQREAAWLPPWRELRRVCHRLEARGELRGGRFIAGLSGEQFALPEAIGLLRSVRQRPHDGTRVCVCGADPLNLTGIVLPGAKIPSLTGARLLYRDGVPVASLVAGEFSSLVEMDPSEAWTARKELLRDHAAHAQTIENRVADAPEDLPDGPPAATA